MAKYPYIVKKGSVWYPAGTEVPDSVPNKENVSEEKQYTKTDIHRMSTAELQNLALHQGIENAEQLTGGELKKLLFEKFEF